MTDSNLTLMQQIRAKWGELIDSTAKSSSVPAAFLAALIANETGGNERATRFEPAVFAALAEVLLGRKAAYGSIGSQDVMDFLVSQNGAPNGSTTGTLKAGIGNLADLATSFGLTQIMGYEAIALHTNGVQAIQSPVSALVLTCKMLAQFSQRAALDAHMPTPEIAGEFFDCWNTGRPHALTADPQYIPNGLLRMNIWRDLEATQ